MIKLNTLYTKDGFIYFPISVEYKNRHYHIEYLTFGLNSNTIQTSTFTKRMMEEGWPPKEITTHSSDMRLALVRLFKRGLSEV